MESTQDADSANEPYASQPETTEPISQSSSFPQTNERRRSDSNILRTPFPRSDTQINNTSRGRRRTTAHTVHIRQESPIKSVPPFYTQRFNTQTNSRQPSTKKQNQAQDDTFYQNLEIRLHHSVGSMSISPTCRDVVLAGRQGLVIIDLEDPWLLPRILPHMSKWEVADVQWSPYVSRESWVASTSNQKLLVWNLNCSQSQAIEYVLHAHSRAISDINWSPHHPDLLATCSVDTYVHLWDLRCAEQSQASEDGRSARPANSFTPWNAATTQVKFNRKSEYLLASAHDKDVKIWDIRKGAVPVTSITAHSKKIYGIDWSRQNDHDIVTCSLDKLVKFWDIHTPEKEKEVIVTNTPVWRARNTPFGHGVLTMSQRSESTLHLYNSRSPEVPVHAFAGHTDTVKEFVWRWKGGANDDVDDREFQLVTWSKDQNLRLWPVSEEILKSVGHDPESKALYPMPAAARLPSNYRPHSFQQTPTARPDRPDPSAVSAPMTPIRLTPGNGVSSSMTPFRSAATAAGNTGFTPGYDIMTNAYREQKYTINPLLWMQNVKTVGPPAELRRDTTKEITYQTVAEEMSVVLNKFASAGVKTEKVNTASRCCTISLHGPWSDTGIAFLRITIRFSPQYPDNSPPEFEIQKNSMISIYYRAHMAQDLNVLASSYTSQKKWCLEPCIRYLLGETIQTDADLSSSAGVGNATDTSVGVPSHATNGAGLPFTSSPGQPGYGNNWNTSTAVDNGDSDDEIFAGPPFMGGIGGGYGMAGKRVSLQSEKGIVVDMSSKQSADEKVPFPRLCGAVFSGSGQLVCFFSTLRVRDSKRSTQNGAAAAKNENGDNGSPASNGEYFENTYSDFYKHPRTYEQFEEYKEIAHMSRQGRNATVLVGGSGGAFGEYAYDDDPDDMDDGLTNMASLYFKPDSLVLGSSLANNDNLLYGSVKPDRITHNVLIANFSHVLPFDSWLAKKYMLSSVDPVTACMHNAQVCTTNDRMDLSRIWYLALEILAECVPMDYEDLLADNDHPSTSIQRVLGQKNLPKSKDYLRLKSKRSVHWGMHPLGQRLVSNLIQHFVRISDVQTAAMLCCIFQRIPRLLHQHRIPAMHTAVVTEKSPETTTLDYFSLKQTHKHDMYASQLINTHGGSHGEKTMTERPVDSHLSQSYGGRGVNFFSYFWDSDRHASPGAQTSTPTSAGGDDHSTPAETPDSVNDPRTSSPKRLRLNPPWMSNYASAKLPSNTAPGLRPISGSAGSAHLPYMTTPNIATPYVVTPPTPFMSTLVANKEGKVIPTEELTIQFTNMEYFDDEKLFPMQDIPLLDTNASAQQDVLRLNYADMLYRCTLLEPRAEVLKFSKQVVVPDTERTMQIQIRCYLCNTEINDGDQICPACRKHRQQIRCSICHVLVKGLSNFCIKCGHGGHSSHMKDWFIHQEQNVCPTGCGCHCLIETMTFGTLVS
ncbi:uncharacterized protein BYT42DRAFT_580098 [Radiomyces spectabilis]|uniref:uncharacterized protein n=1 Tax=Radiomyces spectabilis TaxID=64574 RepID=UPI002220E497|nr:uncharacterized protein BYT42DRAFT_580098 [Radiomyces spectabilis]KAI8371399.1 hypothetical protein BYT42DRAFT_580098 [Radiomyces spectabilis]